MALQEIEFTSRNRRDAIQAWAYEPVGTPAAVVQIIHGLGEHSRRYLHMISALLDASFIVVADDQATVAPPCSRASGLTRATTPPRLSFPTSSHCSSS